MFNLFFCLISIIAALHGATLFTYKKDVGTKIYVGNLNFDTTAETIEEAFKPYGDVIECFMPVDYDGNPRGFAFVSMEEEAALKAIEALNDTELDGRVLNVNKSLPRGQKSKRPARKY